MASARKKKLEIVCPRLPKSSVLSKSSPAWDVTIACAFWACLQRLFVQIIPWRWTGSLSQNGAENLCQRHKPVVAEADDTSNSARLTSSPKWEGFKQCLGCNYQPATGSASASLRLHLSKPNVGAHDRLHKVSLPTLLFINMGLQNGGFTSSSFLITPFLLPLFHELFACTKLDTNVCFSEKVKDIAIS
ncbi:hypothetical protein CDAR_523121 [Caerostris darwini]|uniref:Uncharacterized protein n=1 Tax=Caerostris darwini TaxID=1538125 RepID=A0AAV4TEH2_9ARAC|nr:hypothetical protein CDAR_523121 [Caerostris darwini]